MKNKVEEVFKKYNIDAPIKEIDLNLPIAYKMKFIINTIEITDDIFLMIKEKRRGSLEQFVKQAEFISRPYNGNYILVFNRLSDDEKQLLIKARIPFIDYKGSLFVPSLGLILNKNLEVLVEKTFTPSEQLVFIYLITESKELIVASTVEKRTRVSIATVYRVLNKFVQLGWLKSQHGTYSAEKDLNEILIEGQQYLLNPVKKTLFLEKEVFDSVVKNEVHWGYAGTSALSQLTDLSEEHSIVAMSEAEFRLVNKKNYLTIYEENVLVNQSFVEIQLWKYTPIINDNLVDRLSLYLTLKDVDDPRVEEALGFAMKGVGQNSGVREG
ncbi:helix-turn-helix domain-containing protein [Fundicoccus culcitae]|uniref:Uncharacterized protein n=1 Tax=Fundicoccus culcitae TaxID=2969821 RepID=A0ABY5P8Y7_9LACT|nr:hypothetical protein [Fundicoccus culcitae]UUX35134.1 hypothetical protein NRE15_05695 [Fundicoccus culcitae]